MTIDFNPQIYNNHQVQNLKSQRNILKKMDKDVFIKTIPTDCEGIKIERKDFGTIEKTGEKAYLYTLTNKNGMSVDLSTFGATITGIKVLDKNKQLVDVTQGYDNVKFYEKYPIGHAGGTIGPYANKISNGKFVINNQEYILECNKDNGRNHSHGGSEGLDLKNWHAKVCKDGIEFTYLKKHMENGYPGNVHIKVLYKLDNENNLHIKYKATTDKDTIINLTNHTYFNLDGNEKFYENSIMNHIVKLPNSSQITKIDEFGVPTGEFLKVKNTPFDFKNASGIIQNICNEDEQIKYAKGYDHNYCIDGYNGKDLIEIADIKSEESGINLKVYTNLPGFQFYTANNLGKSSQPYSKNGNKYEKYSALCIEPQYYPNAINTDSFIEKGILHTNEEYNKEIIYSFKTVE